MNRPKIKDVYPLLSLESCSASSLEERKIVLKCHLHSNDNHPTDSDKILYDDVFHHPVVQEILQNPKYPKTIRKSTHNVTIGYDHYTVDQVLSKILPKHLSEIPSSFEVIGHLAHITLREEYYPYKYIIGRIILDKNKGIKVVVNKTGTIQNEFRTFPMEILADDRPGPLDNGQDTAHGDTKKKNLWVEVREDGCRFQLDFEKVYWNSRLQYEHKRIVHLIGGKSRPLNVVRRQQPQNQESCNQMPLSQGDRIIVADACAGIGPFAIPLTSQYDHVEVHANDLNPESYKYLNINAKLNKCDEKGRLHTYNMDARYFLRMLDEKGIQYDHVLMNLPAIAPEFLNVFRGWKGDNNHRPMPMIHVHCFAAKVGGETEAVERCGRSLGCHLDWERDEVSVHQVRNVSPKKDMYCVSFRLPEAVRDVEWVHEFLDGTAVKNVANGNQEVNEKEEKEGEGP
jgi:tRNA (guanine37-N1)-methyltransferase